LGLCLGLCFARVRAVRAKVMKMVLVRYMLILAVGY
jgi:hypothetical protein